MGYSRPMIPLVLDLDGTAACTDTLAETAIRLLATRPFAFLAMLPRALGDRAAFKRDMAAASPLDPSTLVYDDQVLDLARQAQTDRRPVYLATAADRSVADSVSRHLGVFDGVFASDGLVNLKGEAKARLLVERFGAGGFDYAGDSAADLPVWRSARRGYVVAPSSGLRQAAGAVCADVRAIGRPASWLQTARLLARATRLHQWAKNLLVFVPLLAAHASAGGLFGQACLAFLAFSACASSVYVLNDLVDLPHDRLHATKRRRPFASGALNLAWAPGLTAGLLGLSMLLCLGLPWRFAAMLALYYGCTLAYSLVLKRRMVWDVMTLAGLYTLRIFAGGAATGITLSPWLLAFSLFLFFCLAVVKRLTELTRLVQRAAPAAPIAGRGYAPDDLDMLRSMAASSGTMAVLVLALYVNSAEVASLYQRPAALWALCPILLFWVSRVLMLANRGLMNEDPVVFALRDRVSLAAGAASLAAILAAT